MTDRRSLIVPQQDETHVYAGDTGYVVIKQVDCNGDETFVFINPGHVEAVCAAMKSAVADAEKYRAEWKEEGNGSDS